MRKKILQLPSIKEEQINLLENGWINLGKSGRGLILITISGFTTFLFDSITLKYFQEKPPVDLIIFFFFLYCLASRSAIFQSEIIRKREKKEYERRIKRLEAEVNDSCIDRMTGVLNRSTMEKRVAMIWAKARRNKEMRIFLAFLDIDEMKQLNDKHGHALGGDWAIKLVANVIKKNVRTEDDVGRFGGGDEFLFIFTSEKNENELTFENIYNILERIALEITTKSEDKEKFWVSFSIVEVDHINQTFEEVHSQASKEMLETKKRNKASREANIS